MTVVKLPSDWSPIADFKTKRGKRAIKVPSDWSPIDHFLTRGDLLELHHTPAKILSVWLQDQGLLPTSKDEYYFPYVGYLPEQFKHAPDVLRNCVSMVDSGDDSMGRWLREGDYFLRYQVQIRVRGLDYVDAWRTIRKLDKAISHIISVPVKIDDKYYIIKAISRTSGVLPMGIDPGQQTYNFSLNTSGVYVRVSRLKWESRQ